MPRWIVPLPDRLDIFLVSTGTFGSRSKAQEAIDQGIVQVNDTVVTKASLRLQEGDTVVLPETDTLIAPSEIEPVDLHIPILHEDAACLVINKPAGYAVHPGGGMAPGEKTILHGIAYIFTKQGLHFTPDSVLVHRLDKETTGCLLIAKSPEAHRTLQLQFEQRSVQKIYLALVAGIPMNETAKIDAPIGRSVAHRTKMSILGASRSRDAQTSYRTLGTSPKGIASLLECTLHTGRTHQIRVHLSAIGHPILGDDTYVSPESERVEEATGIHALCLHARQVTFRSPDGDLEHTVMAPVPVLLEEAIKIVGIPWNDGRKGPRTRESRTK